MKLKQFDFDVVTSSLTK